VRSSEPSWYDLRTIVPRFRQHNHFHLVLVQLFSDKSAALISYDIGRKKEPCSHSYMCWTEYDGNCRNSVVHTPGRPLCVGLEVLPGILALLVKRVLASIIIPLSSNKLSIVFEGQLYVFPPVVVRSVMTKQSREANEIATPRQVGGRNDREVITQRCKHIECHPSI
jgi:hypothetical protein